MRLPALHTAHGFSSWTSAPFTHSFRYNDRQTVVDDGVSRRLTLREGRNIVRAAIVNAGGATDFCAGFHDEENRAVRGITVRLMER